MAEFEQLFATRVFSDKEMKKRLTPDTYKKLSHVIREGGELDINVANEVAHAMKNGQWKTVPRTIPTGFSL